MKLNLRSAAMFVAFLVATSTSLAQNLLWDYTETAPSQNPDNGLYYASTVNDSGKNNNLKGIKMNSSGYCYFQKQAVEGTLKLSFGPRSGDKESSLSVYTYADTPGAETLVETTEKVTELQTLKVKLTAEQNNIYIKRDASVETVLTRIEFTAGADDSKAVYTITYKDQDGNVLGKREVEEGSVLGSIPYTEANLPLLAESHVFRGWIYSTGKKVAATDVVSGNTTITALVTPREYATVGSVQNYQFNSSTFYPEDHETVSTSGASFHDAQHGWVFANGSSFSVSVAGNAQIVLSQCLYSAQGQIKVTDSNGNQVAVIDDAKVATDGETATIRYEGEATTLTFTYSATAYLHSVVVYNVLDFLTKDQASGYYIVPAGDGASLLLALATAQQGDKIFLPDGQYDFGTLAQTTLSASGVSIIGQSAERTVILTQPENEGLGTADLLVNTGSDNYFQDLSLRNAYPYDANASAGRAASFHDRGNRTIMKNVRLLSHQDTYYSHRAGACFYFDGGEIHGTVDYLCGPGRVYFNDVLLYNEERSSATITANSELYVFNNCRVQNASSSTVYNFGRAWSDNPTCIFLNTTLMDGGAKLTSTRWNLSGINCDYTLAAEYGTKDANGNDITPASNQVTFTKANTQLNTILTADEASLYTMGYTLGDWAATASQSVEQASVSAPSVAGATCTVDDGVYLVEKDGQFVTLFSGTTYTLPDAGTYTLRRANERGGFGAPVEVRADATAIKNMPSQSAPSRVYTLAGTPRTMPQPGINIVDGKKIFVAK